MLPSIIVDNDGTKLTYVDSGPPPSGGDYTTIFAVHGIGYSSSVFRRVAALSPAHGLRIVSINRRQYNGSTPFSERDNTVLVEGTDAEKNEWLKQRGVEMATFIDVFIQRENLPQITPDGKSGGVALLGWSLGATFTTVAIAHISHLPSPVQARLASHIRAHIMQEPPSIIFGLPIPPQTWNPRRDTSMPAEKRLPFFTQWVTGYFQHGDISTKDFNALEYVVPTTSKVPSIFRMSPADISEIMVENPAVDALVSPNCPRQMNVIYRAVTFGKEVRALLPHLQIWELVGDATTSLSIAALWSIQDDDKAHGWNNVNYKILPGLNHFMHWDEPEMTIRAYLEILS